MDTKKNQGISSGFLNLNGIRFQRGMAFGVIIIAALLAFEIFNYSTTDYALADLLGDLSFLGVRWATILAIAFCGIDFAGIARLFTPEEGGNEPTEVWYLFGAWLLAATMNAMLTWWGVSLAILNHETLGNAVIARTVLLRVVPIFVAVLVWLIRVLIIGTFSVAGERMFSLDSTGATARSQPNVALPAEARMPVRSLGGRPTNPQPLPASLSSHRSAPNSAQTQNEPNMPLRPEPTYHSLSAAPHNESRRATQTSFSSKSGTQTRN